MKQTALIALGTLGLGLGLGLGYFYYRSDS